MQNDWEDDHIAKDDHVDEQIRKIDQHGTQSNVPHMRDDHPNELQEYAVNRIIYDAGEGANVNYILLYYGYAPANDTGYPPKPILEHFIV